MPIKDPIKRREYQRQWARKNRQIGSSTYKIDLTREFKLETAHDLRACLEQVTNEVLHSDIDVGAKGRVMAALLSVGVHIIEISDLDARLTAVEERVAEAPRSLPIHA
jgi:hypothetical protein